MMAKKKKKKNYVVLLQRDIIFGLFISKVLTSKVSSEPYAMCEVFSAH